MVSTQRPSRAGRAASNAWLRAGGGFIFGDAPNAVTSAAAIVHQISMHRNTMPPRGTRLSPASSPASIGFTTTVLKNLLPARNFPLLTRIRWINRCPDQAEPSLQTGKRYSTNKGAALPAGPNPGDKCHARKNSFNAAAARPTSSPECFARILSLIALRTCRTLHRRTREDGHG
jgi:hypothetical protein